MAITPEPAPEAELAGLEGAPTEVLACWLAEEAEDDTEDDVLPLELAGQDRL